MRRTTVFIGLTTAGTLILLLSWCRGPHLGTYRFENARLVDSTVLAAIDDHPAAHISPDLIRIEFTSEQDLKVASGGGDLYVHADFCPFGDEYRLLVLGPYYNDRSPYRLLNRRERRLPDGRITVEGEQIHPARDRRTDRYLYTAYLVPSRPARNGIHGEPREGYDLRNSIRDLCLRIDHPGYYLTRSRSDIFMIPGTAVAQASRSGSRR